MNTSKISSEESEADTRQLLSEKAQSSATLATKGQLMEKIQELEAQLDSDQQSMKEMNAGIPLVGDRSTKALAQAAAE